MSVEVTDQLVENIARLARLSFQADEAGEIRSHFEKILRFVAELEELDLSNVDPALFPSGESNVYRKDEVRPSLAPEDALANAPDRNGTSFAVPRIVE